MYITLQIILKALVLIKERDNRTEGTFTSPSDRHEFVTSLSSFLKHPDIIEGDKKISTVIHTQTDTHTNEPFSHATHVTNSYHFPNPEK